MAILSFFRTSKHKRFDYKPLYYDARKEKLQEILKSGESSENQETFYRTKLNGAIRRTSKKRRAINRADKISRSRLLFIILLLATATYYLVIK